MASSELLCFLPPGSVCAYLCCRRCVEHSHLCLPLLSCPALNYVLLAVMLLAFLYPVPLVRRESGWRECTSVLCVTLRCMSWRPLWYKMPPLQFLLGLPSEVTADLSVV